MEYVLKTNGLCKQYKNFKALNRLTMNVPKGSIYGFVGRNGAGKTTLIRLICGLQFATEGSFELYGANSTSGKINDSRRKVGAVVETPSIFPDMTAEDNLKHQFRIIGVPSFEKVKELLELVGLADTGKKKAKDFSLGMRQRLGIANALIGDPDILIFDEPTNGLDPQGIADVRELITKINSKYKKTIIVSSHILSELEHTAHRFGIVHEGVLMKETSLEEMKVEGGKVSIEINDKDLDKAKKLLSDGGITINSVSHETESLEDFYFSLVGKAEGGAR